MNVINTLFGNATSFSSGGPGKGMHARATKNLLHAKTYVESAGAINHLYSDVGLFGIKVSGYSKNVNLSFI